MGIFDWLNHLGNEATTTIEGDEYVELDIVAPYELPVIEQVLADGGVTARQLPTFDAVTGLDKVRLLVAREDLPRSSELLKRLRSRSDDS